MLFLGLISICLVRKKFSVLVMKWVLLVMVLMLVLGFILYISR